MIGCCKSGASKDDFEQDITYTVVLIRHGETTFDKENLFTGWADCPLSERGVEEAKYSGQLLKEAGYSFDLAYTSILKRAIKTLWLILEEMNLMYIPIVRHEKFMVLCFGSSLLFPQIWTLPPLTVLFTLYFICWNVIRNIPGDSMKGIMVLFKA